MKKTKKVEVKKKATTTVSPNPTHEFILMNEDGSTTRGANLHNLIVNRKR